MTNSPIIQIYTDNSLITELASLLFDGYIDNKTVKNTREIDLEFKLVQDNKSQKTSDDKATVTTLDNTGTSDSDLEFENEVNLRITFPTFYALNNIRTTLLQNNIIKFGINKDTSTNKLFCGDFVEFTGTLSDTSIVPTISAIISVLQSYDIKILDTLIHQQIGGFSNASSILNQLKSLYSLLTSNNTTDIVLDTNWGKVVLNVNMNNFANKNAYIYDLANSSFRVLCKVVKISEKNGTVDLLRKTAISGFYNNLLNSLTPYLKVFNDNEILVPDSFTTSVSSPVIMAIPIAMYT